MNPQTAWTSEDDSEYTRLAEEMNEDAKLQFQLFTFAITATMAVLSFLTSRPVDDQPPFPFGLPPGTFFLVPLILLLPTSLMILNRARTRNRKAAYVIMFLDYKRLVSEGVEENQSLDDIRKRPFLPWETALQVLERTNRARKRRVHLGPVIRYMIISCIVIEIFCIVLAYFALRQSQQSMLPLVIVVFVVMLIYFYRISLLIHLRGRDSVQGYVAGWLECRKNLGGKTPTYLQKLIEEYQEDWWYRNIQSLKNVFRIIPTARGKQPAPGDAIDHDLAECKGREGKQPKT